MKLTPRQQKILAAIVEVYTKTGEPVGSKILSQRPDLNAAPATIRSEMARLFELGYLEQPHTSAGRIPSHMGFREYIDTLMTCDPLTGEEQAEIASLFNVKNPDPDKLLEDAAQALAEYTGYASVTSSIVPEQVSVKRIELIIAGHNTAVILLIASNGMIKSRVCRVDFLVTEELIDFFQKFINARFVGRTLASLNLMYINSVSVTLGEYARIFNSLLIALYELCREISLGQYYIGGGSRILHYDELSRLAAGVFTLLEDRQRVHGIFAPREAEFNIIIGKENASSELSAAAVVSTSYLVGGHPGGTVGLIGPVRLNYAKLLPHLEYFAKTLGELLSETLETE